MSTTDKDMDSAAIPAEEEATATPAVPVPPAAPGEKAEDEDDERPDIPRCEAVSRRCDACREAPRGKLHCHNWLDDIPGGFADFDIVEVQFKNTRKGYFRNTTGLDIAKGDIVAVEASPGHDIGEVTLTGTLVAIQMKKAGVKRDAEIKRIFRKAKPADIEKYEEAKARENETMIKARKIAEDLNLNMKIGDVEYQGDGNKAIFYYIADERVDFRKLIKVLAEAFHVRIEMKQIGARQEAGRIGGIGPCGRPLCCSTWMTNFVSVATSAARFQDISLNPQKLAGQCAKLKCCLNFEIDTYVESVRQMPSKDIRLETADNTYFHFKTDIFKREITYSTDKQMAANLVTIPAKRAFEVIALNKAGEKPLSLIPEGMEKPKQKKEFVELVGQDSLTRFDKAKKKKKKKPQQQQKDAQPKPRDNGKDGGNAANNNAGTN
uniref:PSP1 domain-containing protein n=1 Tax=uncultured Muribaculum sp. TaxID=1918613 RepID=UPI002632BB54